jgi:predicted methyltransferase
MNQPVSLVKLAHQLVKDKVKPSNWVIDATAGNGNDTCFLADLVGEQGKVFAFDIQQDAIDNTHVLLQQYGFQEWVELILSDHANLRQHIPANYVGNISVIMFNLGYLPGSDKRIITQSASTLAALNTALELLASGGLITILAYPGHPGGGEETVEVTHWCECLNPQHYCLTKYQSHCSGTATPVLFVIEKIAG